RWLRGHRAKDRAGFWEEPPEESPDDPAPRPPDTGARALLSAVFWDAWEHHHECDRRQDGRPCPQCARDRAWALATAAGWVYSFVSSCEFLGINPEAARAMFMSTAGMN